MGLTEMGFDGTPVACLNCIVRAELYVAAALGLLSFSGCAREKALSSRPPAASAYGRVATNAPNSSRPMIVTPEEGLDGQVAWADSNLRFVVITFPAGQMPAVDRRLSVYRRGLKVGEVKITGPQRDDSVVGDIVAGEAGPGDVARDR
jgi:hypothetical protein